jgi:hypothetical protein
MQRPSRTHCYQSYADVSKHGRCRDDDWATVRAFARLVWKNVVQASGNGGVEMTNICIHTFIMECTVQ